MQIFQAVADVAVHMENSYLYPFTLNKRFVDWQNVCLKGGLLNYYASKEQGPGLALNVILISFFFLHSNR